MRFTPSLPFVLLSLAAGAQSLPAQVSTVQTPLMGAAYDSGLQAIRPLRGIPGASILGEPFAVGFPISVAASASQARFALAANATDGTVHVLRFAGSSSIIVAGAMAAPDRIVISPSGGSAILYQAPNRLQVVAGLPERPVVQDLDVSAVNGGIHSMAVTDDGTLVLLVADAPSGEALWLVSAGSAAMPLLLPGSSVAFRPQSHDALAVTAAGDAYLMQGTGPSAPFQQIRAGDDRTKQPLAVQLSKDGATAYVATASGSVSVISVISGQINTVACSCTPTTLDRIGSRSIFRLTEAANPPLWLLDASQEVPRLWFVPSAPAVSQGNGQ